MHTRTRKWLLTAIKLIVAVVGLWLVARQVPWRDHVSIRPGAVIRAVEVVRPGPGVMGRMWGALHRSAPAGSAPVPVPLADPSIRTQPPGTWVMLAGTQAYVRVPQPDGGTILELRDLGAVCGAEMLPLPDSDLARAEGTGEPAMQVGLRTIAQSAQPGWLLLAWVLLVVPFLATAWRWKLLMEPQGIFMRYRKCLELTFVGQFYSTFLPGITGGDLVKIIYTSRMIGSKTKSTITVLLDRVMGLLSLMVVALIAATIQAPGNRLMGIVALSIAAGLGGLALLATIYFSRRLRRVFLLDRLLNHPGLPDVVRKIDEVLHAYRASWRVLAIGFAIGLFSQLMPPLSSYFAGRAFHMDANLGHYLAFVPVALLAASVPLTPPQGFGVLDYVIYYFFAKQGLASASQAFLLAQAIRFLPVMWNLVGAYWVVTGTYSRKDAPAEKTPPEPSAAAAPE